MTTILKKRSCAIALALAFAAATASADMLVDAKRSGTTTFLSGGLTSDGAQAMRAAAPQYNLRVVFIAHTGQYLADVPVSIKSERGEAVLDGVSEGPMLWVKVPPGRYVVTAQYSGQPQVHRIEVGNQMPTPVFFRWQVTPIDSEF